MRAGPAGTLVVASPAKEIDPEILLEAGEKTENITTSEGGVIEASMDYTLSEEEEGDNINGNKQLRELYDNEDENNSQRH